jgi:hypothetical protein
MGDRPRGSRSEDTATTVALPFRSAAAYGQTGADRIFQGAADFDLELIESRTLDSNIQELIYRPTLHV